MPESKWERRFDAALGIAAGAILFVMMLLTFVDVVARYLFNFPLRGGSMRSMKSIVTCSSACDTSGRPAKISTSSISSVTSKPPRSVMLVVRAAHALCAAVMFFLTWQVWIKANRIAGYGDTTDVIKIPVGPFVYFMAAMILLTGLVHLYKVFVPGAASASQATT